MTRTILIFVALMVWQSAGGAETFMAGSVHISAPWARELPPVSRNGAAYLTVTNKGETADRLVGASSPVAERVALHETSMEGGMMRMRPVQSLVIEPGETRVLEPGGLHFMMIKLREPLTAGMHFLLTLEFAESGRVDVKVEVTGSDGPRSMDHGGHSG